MPRGYRCILIAFVGWLSLAAGPPKQPAANPQDGTSREVAAALNNLATALQQPEKPSKHDEPCKAGNNNRTSDLCAQWKAADAAKSASQAAWWIGALGTLIGAFTLAAAWAAAVYAKEAAKHTKSAADQAERQANAADSTLRETIRTTRAQLRTYLASESETYSIDDESKRVSIDFTFRNVGLTPAYDTTMNMRSTFIGGTGEGKPRLVKTDKGPFGTVGPGAKVSMPADMELTEGEIKAIDGGTGFLMTSVSVKFRDEFGDRWLYEHNLVVDRFSRASGLQYTRSCHTKQLTDEKPQDELPLEGGKAGRPEPAE